MFRNTLSISATCVFLLAGCGGGGSSSSDDTGSANVLTGIFVDSAVEGVSYTTETRSDVTNAAGEFSYLQGENVTFSIGSLTFPTIPAAAQVSPVDMASGSADPSATTTNIARLLQSLDEDGNPDNGIKISTDAAAMATLLNFDVPTAEFENNVDVINLVAGSGSVTTSLISADAANTHLNNTLGTTTDNNGDVAFNVDTLVSGSPWYAIRVYEDGGEECGNRYTFSANGFTTGISNGASVTGTYALSESGLLNIDTVQFGVENWQLNSLNSQEWSTNKDNNSGRAYLERVFSNRSSALELSSSLGTNCEAVFPENLTPELATVGYVPELGQGDVNGITCDADHVGTPGTPGGQRDNIMRDALETGNYAFGIQQLDGLGGVSEGISVYRAYLDTQDIQATADIADVTVETVASRLACAGMRQ